MARNRIPVKVAFSSKMSSKAVNCRCHACFKEDRVIKLKLPNSNRVISGDMITCYHEYWLCRECRDKLAKALEWGVEDGK